MREVPIWFSNRNLRQVKRAVLLLTSSAHVACVGVASMAGWRWGGWGFAKSSYIELPTAMLVQFPTALSKMIQFVVHLIFPVLIVF